MALTKEQREEIGRRYWTERESAQVLADDFGITREWATKVARDNKPPTQKETPDSVLTGRGLATSA